MSVQTERHPKWGESVRIRFYSCWLDDPRHLRRYGVDPEEFIRKTREAGDTEGRARGLVFIGEVRKGTEIERQYVNRREISWFQRLWFRFFAHNEKPLTHGR